MDFVEQVLEHFQFSCAVSQRDRENIPPCGRVVIIANYPIGSLDGLALLRLAHEVRSDVRIVAPTACWRSTTWAAKPPPKSSLA